MVRKKKKITESKANPSMSEKETVSSKEKAASKETKSPRNTDVDIDTSNFEKAVDTAVEFEPVLAEEVLEQAGVSIKVENKGAGAVEHPGIAENLTGIKPSVSSNQKRHLLSQSMSKHWSFRQNRRMLSSQCKGNQANKNLGRMN